MFSIAFRPDDSRIMYLGTNGNEVFRSEDSGDTWKYMSIIEDPDQVEMPFPVRILWMDMERSNPDVMYAAMEVGGAARSMDAGRSWELINNGLVGADLLDVHAVAVGSPKSDAVFIANRKGVFRSRDRGDHWENMHLEQFSPIYYSRGVRVAPDDPNTVYACISPDVHSEQGGVMRSRDLGETWERFDHGVDPRSAPFGLTINRRHPEAGLLLHLRRGSSEGAALRHPRQRGHMDRASPARARVGRDWPGLRVDVGPAHGYSGQKPSIADEEESWQTRR